MTGAEMVVLIATLSLIAGTQALLVARSLTRLEHTVAALDDRILSLEKEQQS